MRGIAFIGGETPPPELARRLLDEAAAGGERLLVAAADSGLIAAEQAGAEIAWITGDMDSLEDLCRLERYPPDRVIRHPPDKDYTDTELALKLLADQGCGKIWLLGGGGGRADHLLALVSLFEGRKKPERWLTAREDIRPLDAGETADFTLRGRTGPVSVFPRGRGPWQLESRGLRWPLDAVPWRRGRFSISNECVVASAGAPSGDAASCGFFLRAVRGSFLVLLPLPVYS
jgi:thiamine pyrophosphokinase